MSWGVSSTGKSTEVAAEIEKQFEGMKEYPCPEPEESIKQDVRALIAKALAGNIPDRDVVVSAGGSMSRWIQVEGGPETITNQLVISVQ